MKQQNSKKITKSFAKYVSLNILGMLGISFYILADTFFVARGVGANGLTALNLAIPIYSFIFGIGQMIGMGSATRFSISNKKDTFTQSLYFMIFFSVIFVLLGVFAAPYMANILGADGETFEMTKDYLRIVLCFSPAFMLNSIVICFVRNDHNPKLAMAGMIIGSLANIVLDYIFVFPLQMGLRGAALATGVTPILGLVILSFHFLRPNNRLRLQKVLPSFKMFVDISSLGLSSFLNELSSGIVIIVFNFLLLRYAGNTGVAAYGVLANIGLVVMSVFTGISQGMQPLCSRSYGENDIAELKKLLHMGLITMAVSSAISYVLLIAFSAPIITAFNKDGDAELFRLAQEGMRLYFIYFAFAGFNIISATYLSSIEKPKFSFAIAILRGFVIIIPFAVLFSYLFGIKGIWLSMTFAEVFVMIVAVSSLLYVHRKSFKIKI